MRYQDPILLAEAAGTTDLLVGGRLELAISGEVLHTVAEPSVTELRVTPHSPTLRSRIRHGSGSRDSAVQAAELGIGLISGTVQHDLAESETFGEYQARSIADFRTTWRHKWGTTPPPVAVSASILVGATNELREKYTAYDLERRTQGIAAFRPKGALQPTAAVNQPPGARISPVYHGKPDQVTEAVLNDPGLAAADEVVRFLPPAFGLAENVRLLSDLVEVVAPAMGWAPAW